MKLKVGCLSIKWFHWFLERQQSPARDGWLGCEVCLNLWWLMKQQLGDMPGKNVHMGNASSRHSRPCWLVAPNRSCFCWINLYHQLLVTYRFFGGRFKFSGFRPALFCCWNFHLWVVYIFKPFNPHFPFFSCPWSFFCWLHLLFMNFSSQFLKVCSPFWCVKSQFFCGFHWQFHEISCNSCFGWFFP